MNTKTKQAKKPAKKPVSTNAVKKTRARVVRPPEDKKKILAIVLDGVRNGNSLRTMATKTGVAIQTLDDWLNETTEIIGQYTRAREVRADFLAEETIAIADNGVNDTYIDEDGNVKVDHDVIARSRLRVETRKWFASKLFPRRFGDKVAIGGAEDLPPIKSTVEMSPDEAYKLMMKKPG